MATKEPCPTCGILEKDQHTLGQAAICDGIKNGNIKQSEGQEMIKRGWKA